MNQVEQLKVLDNAIIYENFENRLKMSDYFPLKACTIDITGGSPETNSHLEWFIEKTSGLEKRLIVRSNLVILLEKDFKKYTDIYSENRVEIIGSLPDYRPEKADRQRGEGSFEKCIRALKFLLRTDNYNDYLQELHNSYNPANVNNVMCRVPISVGWDGRLYDCDFNQMLGLTISDPEIQYIDDFDMEKLSSRKIVIRNHCYGCTAGAGSSCQGSLE